MILMLGLLSVLFCGYAAMLIGLHNAPEGYEADGEFHVLWRNNAPDVSNIVCIWSGKTVEIAKSRPHRHAA